MPAVSRKEYDERYDAKIKGGSIENLVGFF